MHTTIKTTITTEIDLDGLTPSHRVEVHAEDVLPQALILAAVEGGLVSALDAVQGGRVDAARIEPVSDAEGAPGA